MTEIYLVFMVLLFIFLVGAIFYNEKGENKKEVKVDVDEVSALADLKEVTIPVARYIELLSKEEDLQELKLKIKELSE